MKNIRQYQLHIFCAAVAVIYLMISIFKSTNSTAAIGFIMIPVFAAIGVFVGDSLQYGWDLLLKKRPHSVKKTALIIVVLAFSIFKWLQSNAYAQNLLTAKNPTTPLPQLMDLLSKNDSTITAALATNPALPLEQLDSIITNHLSDYNVIYSALQNPSLNVEHMKRIAALEPTNFKGKMEYEIYQNFVWAALAKRSDIPSELVHVLAAKPNPQHFLILALLESNDVTCEEKQKFLPQPNSVLENAIQKSIQQSHCSDSKPSSK